MTNLNSWYSSPFIVILLFFFVSSKGQKLQSEDEPCLMATKIAQVESVDSFQWIDSTQVLVTSGMAVSKFSLGGTETDWTTTLSNDVLSLCLSTNKQEVAVVVVGVNGTTLVVLDIESGQVQSEILLPLSPSELKGRCCCRNWEGRFVVSGQSSLGKLETVVVVVKGKEKPTLSPIPKPLSMTYACTTEIACLSFDNTGFVFRCVGCNWFVNCIGWFFNRIRWRALT